MRVPSRVLVTGARGFLGRQLVSELHHRFPAVDVVAVSRRPPHADRHPGPVLDLCKAEAWRQLDGRYDWIIHLAARIPSSGGDPLHEAALYEANVKPTLHLVEACRAWQPARLIYVSSIAVYPMGAAPVLHEDLVPNPDTWYGTAKLAGEHLVALAASSSTGVVSLRPSSIYGPGQAAGTVLPLFMDNAVGGRAIGLVAGGARTQDFVHVADAARGIVDAAASEATGTYNLAAGTATSMLELARAIAALPGCNVEIIDRGGVERAPAVKVDITKARREWGYAPSITLAKGIGSYHASLLAGVP
jgi:UDP-glucose 4-epimerase